MNIFIPKKEDISSCAEVYISAYEAEPWNEKYDRESVKRYISDYLGSETKQCFAAEENGKIIGIALGIIVPSIDAPFLRIEDFCVSAEAQGRGYGKEIMRLVCEKAKESGCDSVLLGTLRDFPSHKFYLKNGFSEVDSVLLYKEL
ncbi:MAG: GNAT family N-acetyltransferase [Ruminococcaceae bacterium]|nr:GNAT family N-acetyltransferase [Oscillospiraceae bacterium]